MENICGGKEAEIEDAISFLNKIREEKFIDKGLIGDYFPLILDIVNSTFTTKECTLLHRSAILSFTKIICVSSQLC
jgi:hypothetical protein